MMRRHLKEAVMSAEREAACAKLIQQARAIVWLGRGRN
jgi:hypothetical protein